jgi:predicted DNA-binding antitoxin AbrB/MazE fold protein
MVQTIPAVFEHGVFRPLKKVYLEEHQRFLLKLEIPKDKYESLLETLEILNDKKQLDQIQSALKDTKKGKVFSHKDIFGHSQPNL